MWQPSNFLAQLSCGEHLYSQFDCRSAPAGVFGVVYEGYLSNAEDDVEGAIPVIIKTVKGNVCEWVVRLQSDSWERGREGERERERERERGGGGEFVCEKGSEI